MPSSSEPAEVPDPTGGLPDFSNPPVVETVLGVSFHEVVSLDTMRLGQLWASCFANSFPIHEDHPHYAPPIELEEGSNNAALPSIGLAFGPPPLRHVLISADQHHLIQIQRDWFAFNWRKTDSADQYRRYEFGRAEFVRQYELFEQYLASGGDDLKPTQCEVTYLNHIYPDSNDDRIPLLQTPLLKGHENIQGDHLPPPSDLAFTSHYSFRREGKLLGRLHVEAKTVPQELGQPRYASLSLTARGEPPTPDLAGILSFLDMGREWVVRGFEELTTAKMHARWGQRPTGEQEA